METVLRAPFRARLKECPVSVGSQVETGAPLLRLEPFADDDVEEDGAGTAETVTSTCPLHPRSPPGPTGPSAARRPAQSAARLRCRPARQRRVLDDYLAARRAGRRPSAAGRGARAPRGVRRSRRAEPQQPAGEDRRDSHVHSAREYFHTYLQSLDSERAGLPEAFQAKLAKVLGHYGVTELEPSPELEAAVFRIFLAQQRSSADAAIVASCCGRGCRRCRRTRCCASPRASCWSGWFRRRRSGSPWSADLARGVVFAWLGQPLLRRNRARVYDGVRKNLRHLDENPDAPDRDERIGEMVAQHRAAGAAAGAAPQPRGAWTNARHVEVLTRRYYGNKGLAAVRTSLVAGCTFRGRRPRGFVRVASSRSGLRSAGTAPSAGSRSGLASGEGKPSTPISISPGRTSRRTPKPRAVRTAQGRQVRTRCRSQVRRA